MWDPVSCLNSFTTLPSPLNRPSSKRQRSPPPQDLHCSVQVTPTLTDTVGPYSPSPTRLAMWAFASQPGGRTSRSWRPRPGNQSGDQWQRQRAGGPAASTRSDNCAFPCRRRRRAGESPSSPGLPPT